MSLEISTQYAVLIILIMAIVTLATRWGGMLIMSYIPIGPRVQRFIHAMSGSVLIAILAPVALEGDHGARLALLSTFIVMLISRKPLIAISAGILAAAMFRQFVG